MAPGDNPEIFKELIHDHIPYEVRMLRTTLICSTNAMLVMAVNPLVMNSFVESFCIHARNLFEFFDETRSVSKGYVAARHFTEASYQPFPSGRLSDKKTGLISKQIAHITYDRTSEQEKKIGTAERVEFMQAIEDELENFGAHLKVSYRELWPRDMKDNRIRFQ